MKKNFLWYIGFLISIAAVPCVVYGNLRYKSMVLGLLIFRLYSETGSGI